MSDTLRIDGDPVEGIRRVFEKTSYTVLEVEESPIQEGTFVAIAENKGIPEATRFIDEGDGEFSFTSITASDACFLVPDFEDKFF